MTSHRVLTLSPDYKPLWVRLYVHRIEGRWEAMLVADEVPPPEPGELRGARFGDTSAATGKGEGKKWGGDGWSPARPPGTREIT